jgi:hypothetical protein
MFAPRAFIDRAEYALRNCSADKRRRKQMKDARRGRFRYLHPSQEEAARLMLLILRLGAQLDHLAPTIGSTALAHPVRAHQLATLAAKHQRWCIQALVLAAIAAAVTRDFCFWYGTHDMVLNPFFAISRYRLRISRGSPLSSWRLELSGGQSTPPETQL